MASIFSSDRSLSDVESFEENLAADGRDRNDRNPPDRQLSSGGSSRSHGQSHSGTLVHLDNGDCMGAADLVRCLDELDNAMHTPGPSWRPVPDTPRLLRPPHCRREAVVCVVSLKTASTFCYAVISRLGRVGVYDNALTLLDSYTLELGFDHPHAKIGIGREGDLREPRQHTTWVNDAVFLPDAQMLIVAASDRSLTILDASRLLHCRRCEVRSLPAAPRCMAYAPGSDGAGDPPSTPSRLFIGDDVGTLTTLTFLQPRRALLRPPDVENKSTSYFWPEIRHQGDWVAVHQDHKVHGDAVCRLWYDSHNDTLLSASRDPRQTLVIRHLAGRREPYVFSLPRGASCFVLDRPLQLLVTAGRDAVVRLWNPLVPGQPQAALLGHKQPVLDVAVVGILVVSMDLQGVLKVWHASEHCCLQTLPLPFTCLLVPGRRIEHGARTLYAAPAAPSDADGASQLVAALCGELVTIRISPAWPASPVSAVPDKALAPPRRDQSPAIPESWSPSLLSPTSTSTSSARGPRRGSFLPRPAGDALADDTWIEAGDDDDEGDHSDILPKSASPLPESINDWPVPDDRLFKEELPPMHRPTTSRSSTSPPEPVSHRPVPDENGLYPEELASLKALGLRPLDLEAIGVSLSEHCASGASGTGRPGALSLLPMDAMAAVRQAHVAQKKSHKQMRTLAWHCAPHLALKLPEETPLRFSRTLPLPVSTRMRAKAIDVADPQRLMQAKLNRLGLARQKTSLQVLGGSTSAASSGRQSSVGGSGNT